MKARLGFRRRGDPRELSHEALIETLPGVDHWAAENLSANEHMADSKKLERGHRKIYVGLPSFFGLGLEGGHVPTSWLLQ